MTIQSGHEESQEVGPIPEIEKPQEANGEGITLKEGTFKLSRPNGEAVPWTWSAIHLKKYYQ